MENTKITPGYKAAAWTVLSFVRAAARRRKWWLCRCVCGTERVILESYLLNISKRGSCGCVRNTWSLPVSYPREYCAYSHARDRCNNQNHKSYKHYGGRGIEFRFNSFDEFFAEVGARPTSKHCIDRINNNGHYEKGNLKWSTWIEQNNNRRPFSPRRVSA